MPLLPGEFREAEPPCPHFGACGGCLLQNLPYPAQLAFKREVVRRAFLGQGLEVDPLLSEVAGMADPWHYRNKADFNIRPAGGIARLGFTRADARGVLEVEQCPISSLEINQVLAAFRQILPEFGSLRRRLHSIIVRSSRHEKAATVLYHTRLKDPAVFSGLSGQLMAACPIVKGAAFIDRRREVAVGCTTLTERVLDIDYTYRLSSFFQANPLQTETLVRTVLELAQPQPQDVAADVYAGVGLFTLQLARLVREVHSIEDTPSAVDDAAANAARAGISNCRFHRGQAQECLGTLDLVRTGVSLAVLDPPRSGCSEATLALLPRFAPRRMVYVSCNPLSLARDAKVLVDAGFRLTALRPVDMFPQTTHVECVACFER
ncbi:MAG: 23S rRNA (uracil(1939)-C(5))-methyltransferase RlmD [Candidatus Riflebacteria bacterium]|nr:23S rRNA (uracil(1939)-C(5))-methyltransferase RlmD [Candidatus Riflebacteria bacterium]